MKKKPKAQIKTIQSIGENILKQNERLQIVK